MRERVEKECDYDGLKIMYFIMRNGMVKWTAKTIVYILQKIKIG